MSARNLYTWNKMLSGYAKMGMINPAKKLFDKMPEKDIVSWNTMVIAFARSGCCDEAVRFYSELRRQSIGYNEFSLPVHGQVLIAGFTPNVVISSSVLDAYAKFGEMGYSRRVFDDMSARDVLAWTTLVSGYAKWGDMHSASEMFDRMPEKNPVSWTALIAGYARNGLGYEALELFTKMMMLQIKPDQFTFSSCLCACASLASLKHGKQMHACLIRNNFRPNTIVVSSLIDMYSKCGSLEIGKWVFNLMGVKPDRTTFVVTLNACSHSGLVQEGLKLFNSMTCDHCIIPDQDHYACLVDILGRAGRFDELMEQLEKMPCKPGDRVLNALLGLCQIHGNIESGRKAAEHLIELEPRSSAAYLVEKLRKLMDERHFMKERAVSWIEIGKEVHAKFHCIR
ncbi:hypothetical protein I3842_05G077700 [Carya illinoinensis]|uniref:Pentatricopeptide repeat-containing protein n=1 Tax=Carya illinoinensis TaxID=32201 RepID=A0A922F229_CARIL|nr:hypothetical protein I3842_05G077700 [Carya illinoinensis]